MNTCDEVRVSAPAANTILRNGTLDDLEHAPNFDDLIAQYEDEAKIIGLPARQPNWAMYRAMEQAGAFHVICAHRDGELVGFATLIASIVPHYGVLMCTSESIFVVKAHRKGGLGLRLLRAAQAKAKELGAQALFVSAPSEGALAKVLPRVGFKETNRSYFRKLSDG